MNIDEIHRKIVEQIKVDLNEPIKKYENSIIDNPIVSVIIPVRNNLELLKNTINSLVMQKNKDFEIIVIDDDSQDNILDYIKNVKFSINYLKYSRSDYDAELPIRRAGQLRNIGAKYAKGDVLIFLDSDMIVKNNFIDKHLHYVKLGQIVLGTRNNDGRNKYFEMYDDIAKMPNPWKMLHSHNFSCMKNDFLSVGGFSNDFIFWGGEDEELGYKFYKKGIKFILDKKNEAIHQDHISDSSSKVLARYLANYNYQLFYNKYKDENIKKSYKFIDSMSLKVFDKCNNNCIFCDVSEKKGKFQTSEDIIREITIAKNFGIGFRLGGGEIILHPDFKRLLPHLQNTEISTNARIFSIEKYATMVSKFVLSYYVYLYGSDIETRTNDSYKQSVKGLQNLVKCNVKLSIHIVLTENTITDLDKIYATAIKYTHEPVKIEYLPINSDIDKIMNDIDTIKNFSVNKKIVLKNSFFSCYGEDEIIQKRGCTGCQLFKYCKSNKKFIEKSFFGTVNQYNYLLIQNNPVKKYNGEYDQLFYTKIAHKILNSNMVGNDNLITILKNSLKNQHYAKPKKLFIELTRNCNGNCIMCGHYGQYPKYDKKWDMDFNMFKNIANELFETAQYVELRGFGESTYMNDFEKYLEYANKYKVRKGLVTNLTVQNKKLWEEIINSNMDLGVSVDGSYQELYEKIRAGSRFSNFLINLELLSKHKEYTSKKVYFMMAIQKLNYHDISGLLKLANKYNVKTVEFNPVKSGSFSVYNVENILLEKSIENGKKLAKKLGINIKFSGAMNEIQNKCVINECLRPKEYAIISYDGKVGPCNHRINPILYFGNLSENSFEEIWNGPMFNFFRNTINTMYRFNKCNWCYEKRIF